MKSEKTILKDIGVFLFVVILVLMSMDISNHLTQTNAQANPTTIWLSSAKTTNQSNEQKPYPIELDKPIRPLYINWLHYDSNSPYASYGWGDGSPYEWGIRLTPDELKPYNGCWLTTVKFYHGAPFSPPGVTQSGFVKVYTAGTASKPGMLITAATTPWTHTMPGWIDVILASPVQISAYNDTWITVNVTTFYNISNNEHPAGIDKGPATPFKGDWYKVGESWAEMRSGGVNRNWNIWAGIECGTSGIPDLKILEPLTVVGDNVYEKLNLWSNVKQEGRDVFRTPSFLKWPWCALFYVIELQNDGTVPLSYHTIETYIVNGDPSTEGDLYYREIGGTITSIPIPGSTAIAGAQYPITIAPKESKYFLVAVGTPTSAVSSLEIGVHVISTYGSDDSVRLIP
jgi:hypothetical protein